MSRHNRYGGVDGMDTISHRGPLLWRSGGPGLRDDIRPSGRSFLAGGVCGDDGTAPVPQGWRWKMIVDVGRRKSMAENWLQKHPWLMPYIAGVVTVSLILQVVWR